MRVQFRHHLLPLQCQRNRGAKIMKRITIVSTVVMLILNIAANLIFPNYHLFNLILSSVILCHTGIVLYVLALAKISDGFRYSLGSIFIFIGLVGFIISLFSSNTVKGNWLIFILLVVTALEWIIIYTSGVLKKSLDKGD